MRYRFVNNLGLYKENIEFFSKFSKKIFEILKHIQIDSKTCNIIINY